MGSKKQKYKEETELIKNLIEILNNLTELRQKRDIKFSEEDIKTLKSEIHKIRKKYTPLYRETLNFIRKFNPDDIDDFEKNFKKVDYFFNNPFTKKENKDIINLNDFYGRHPLITVFNIERLEDSIIAITDQKTILKIAKKNFENKNILRNITTNIRNYTKKYKNNPWIIKIVGGLIVIVLGFFIRDYFFIKDETEIYKMDDKKQSLNIDANNMIIKVTKFPEEYPITFNTEIDSNNQVTVIPADTNFINTWLSYYRFHTNSSTPQKIRMRCNITLPYDLKELHNDAFEVQYKYGTADTINQKIHLTMYKNGNATALIDTTFPFSTNWGSCIISKTSLSSNIALESYANINMLFDVTVKSGSEIGLGFIRYSYIKDNKK